MKRLIEIKTRKRKHQNIGYSSSHPLYNKTYYQEVTKPKRTPKPLSSKNFFQKYTCLMCGHPSNFVFFDKDYSPELRLLRIGGYKSAKWYHLEELKGDGTAIFKLKLHDFFKQMTFKCARIIKRGLAANIITQKDFELMFSGLIPSESNELTNRGVLHTNQGFITINKGLSPITKGLITENRGLTATARWVQ